MNVTKADLRARMDDFYVKNHPDLVMTKRIKDHLSFVVLDQFEQVQELTDTELYSLADTFFDGKETVEYIKECQPNRSPVPEEVISDLKQYFAKEMPSFKPLAAYRKSNHPEDSYLYMVEARAGDGTYACWTAWNQSTRSLNYGHYGYENREAAREMLQSKFYDITEEPEKYGMEQSKAVIQEEVNRKNERTEKGTDESAQETEDKVINMNRHKMGR